MRILPAIDLKDGICVRLRQGEYDSVYQVARDAVQTARSFLKDGAQLIHMVDLDGAKDGVGKNRAVIQRVMEETGAAVELGGGIRSLEDLEQVFSLGVSRAVIGSAAVENPDLVRRAVELYGEKIAVGLDVRGGTVRTQGWREDSSADYLEFARKMEAFGVKTLIFTDIETDGMLTGPNLKALSQLQEAVSCGIVASGGISSLADLRALKELGIPEVIVGKAVYSGDVDLKAAIALGAE